MRRRITGPRYDPGPDPRWEAVLTCGCGLASCAFAVGMVWWVFFR